MATLTITAASVALGGSNVNIQIVQAGEAVTQGMTGYIASDNKAYKGHRATSATTANVKGVFLTPAATNGYAILQTDGPIIIGATVAVATNYVVAASGLIMPEADLATADYPTSLGRATTAAIINLKIDASGVAKP